MKTSSLLINHSLEWYSHTAGSSFDSFLDAFQGETKQTHTKKEEHRFEITTQCIEGAKAA